MLPFGGSLLDFHLGYDRLWNNKHSRNFLWCSRLYVKDCNNCQVVCSMRGSTMFIIIIYTDTRNIMHKTCWANKICLINYSVTYLSWMARILRIPAFCFTFNWSVSANNFVLTYCSSSEHAIKGFSSRNLRTNINIGMTWKKYKKGLTKTDKAWKNLTNSMKCWNITSKAALFEVYFIPRLLVQHVIVNYLIYMAKNDISNISNTKDHVWPQFQTQRRDLKIQCGVDTFDKLRGV